MLLTCAYWILKVKTNGSTQIAIKIPEIEAGLTNCFAIIG